MGIPGATINVPAICDMIETLKTKKNYDEETANNMASAIYKLGLNFGEVIGPIIGGYITNKRNFSTSCVYVSMINFMYCVIFGAYNYKRIVEYVTTIDKDTTGDMTTNELNRNFLTSC